jgi:site-specific DNA-methyltransferase (adenine-specific)
VIRIVEYQVTDEKVNEPLVLMEPSAYASNRCVFRDDRFGIWLYQSNCLEFMDILISKYPDGKFDMIFADPPYFLSNGGITCHAGKMVKVDKGQWDRSSGPDLNHEFNLAWISRCQQLLRPHGTIWVSGTHHVIHSIGFAMQQCGMKILNDISWEKPNPPPNLSCRYFTHSTETIIWAAKSEKSKHTFNYGDMRAQNGGKQMKTVWTIKAPQKREKLHGKHPTQKPESLMERIIQASTNVGDLIFDPFAGSCTTGVAAARLGRRFVGCELEGDFIAMSKNRLRDILSETRFDFVGDSK